ncbi:MAG: class I SAM-dependent methyltransferase [Saprospiraceae bacterium]|nr:class I SAM-dependent methyltransferase [Saprospiraceae bacterium]
MNSLLIQRLFLYSRYYLSAKSIYQMHAPYLFELLQFVYDPDRNYYDFIKIHEASKSLESNYNLIAENDFSKTHQQAGLSIGAMYKKSGHTLTAYECLYRLVTFIKPKNSLELGASVGMSGLSMALANKYGIHTSVEGNSSLAESTNRLFQNYELNSARCLHSRFDEFLSNNPRSNLFDFVFIDGDHRYQATLDNFNKLLDMLTEDAVLLIDDIHWSAEMHKAWIELSRHPSIHCSLEMMRWGLLFKSKKLTKGCFSYIPVYYKPWQKFI